MGAANGTHTMGRVAKACPLFAAADPAQAAAWYSEKLGFFTMRTYDDYSIVERDGVEIHFWKCADRNIAENTSAHFRVEDVDAVHREMSRAAQGGRISPVMDRDWGMREFYIWDPEGNLLRFGQPLVTRDTRN